MIPRIVELPRRRPSDGDRPWRAFLWPIAWTAAATLLLVGITAWMIARSGDPSRPREIGAPPPPGSAAPLPEPAGAPPGDAAAAVERRLAAGELGELRRRPGGCVVERVAWADAPASRILKVLELRDGGAAIVRWYDDAGRLRAWRAAAGGAASAGELDAGGAAAREQGDPALGALARSAPDPSTALFGRPECPR